MRMHSLRCLRDRSYLNYRNGFVRSDLSQVFLLDSLTVKSNFAALKKFLLLWYSITICVDTEGAIISVGQIVLTAITSPEYGLMALGVLQVFVREARSSLSNMLKVVSLVVILLSLGRD